MKTILFILGHSSRQHSGPEGCPPLGHQRQRDDQGLPQAQDQSRKGLRHQGANKSKKTLSHDVTLFLSYLTC